jgi:hypothetical protein
VRRLKHLLAQPLKYGANKAAEQADREAPRYIRITDIDKSGNLVNETFRSIPEEVARSYLLQDGDILLARSGATVGKAYLYSEAHGRAAYAGYLIRARVNPRLVLQSYLYAFLQSLAYWTWISSITIQATIQNVSAEKYASLFIPLPPSSEQSVLLQTIADGTRAIESAMFKAQREIDLIREYRTRLIADVVTGKLDVREVAATLPDEANEREELDGAETITDGDEAAEDADLEVAVEEAEA